MQEAFKEVMYSFEACVQNNTTHKAFKYVNEKEGECWSESFLSDTSGAEIWVNISCV